MVAQTIQTDEFFIYSGLYFSYEIRLENFDIWSGEMFPKSEHIAWCVLYEKTKHVRHLVFTVVL